ncbi:hypothetical protein BD410DRAFT_54336 [Rickenella mellea]|uniref:Uncharacterized protein n=1 Tax=Rickenella mellea TaxID=50990 RepID=A0A4R5XG87_9AGAM|nr:hypothetical protein BD410DRAFT_54336 [Rickenella mellea]
MNNTAGGSAQYCTSTTVPSRPSTAESCNPQGPILALHRTLLPSPALLASFRLQGSPKYFTFTYLYFHLLAILLAPGP